MIIHSGFPADIADRRGILRRRGLAHERRNRHRQENAGRLLVVEITRERQLALEHLDVDTTVRLLGGLPANVRVRDAARRGPTREHVAEAVIARVDVDGLLEQVVADLVVAEAAPRAAQLHVVDESHVLAEDRLVRNAPCDGRRRERAVLLVWSEAR